MVTLTHRAYHPIVHEDGNIDTHMVTLIHRAYHLNVHEDGNLDT